MNELEFKIQLHNKLYDLTNLFLYQYSPCQVEGTNCMGGEVTNCCLGSRFRCKISKGCAFLGERGCTAENIICRVWLCAEAKQVSPICTEALGIIESLAKLYELTT